MSAPELAALLHLVDRVEKGTILAPEVVALRAGLRAWASEVAQARRTVGGLTAENRRLRQQLGDAEATGGRVRAAETPEAPEPHPNGYEPADTRTAPQETPTCPN